MRDASRWLRERLIAYIIVFFASVGGAVLFALLGGSLASVHSEKLGFQATGAIAGFVIIFGASLYFLTHLPESEVVFKPLNIVLSVRGRPQFSADDTYEVECVIVSDGEARKVTPYPAWKDKQLTLDLNEIGPDDRIRGTIRNQLGMTWEIASFDIKDQVREAQRKALPVAAVAESESTVANGQNVVKRTFTTAQLESTGPRAETTTTFGRQSGIRNVSNTGTDSTPSEVTESRQLPAAAGSRRSLRRATNRD